MSSQLVASGGEDDKAYVWKASNGEVLLECTGGVFLFLAFRCNIYYKKTVLAALAFRLVIRTIVTVNLCMIDFYS